MRITEVAVDAANLDTVLTRSYEEFIGNSDYYADFRLRFSLGISDPLIDVKYYEISEGSLIWASFMLVFTRMNFNDSQIKICFLTQVIISKEYRGRGLSYQLSQYAEELAENEGAGITFVIARRAVKDLYGKLGFVGFSHFSELELGPVPGLEKTAVKLTREPKSSDLRKIIKLHEASYRKLNFNLIRSEESFQNLIESPKYTIEISENESFYLVSHLRTIVEIGMNSNTVGSEIIATIIREGFDSIRINRNHEIFRIGVGMGFVEKKRFELREGHLLRIHRSNLSPLQLSELENFILNPGAQFAEILEVDQW